jgi:predicted HNH restriction endonuclease
MARKSKTKLPPASVFVDALRTLDAHPIQRNILIAQYHFPKHAATARQLAAVSGFKGFPASNLAYGLAGKHVSEHLQLKPPHWSASDPNWWSMLSKGDGSHSEFTWIMHPPVAQAMQLLGWVNDDDAVLLPGENPVADDLTEGASLRVSVNIFERSPEARRRCIAHYGCRCVVCGFDFAKVYGEFGEGFIHVHHLIPLSEIDEEYVVEPIRDLRPVCPNCHAMIHRKSPPLGIDELMEILQEV